MAQPTISLFIDVQNRQLVRSFTSTVPAILPVAYQGDTVNLALRFLQATGVNSAPYTDIDYSTAAVTVAVGFMGAKPTAGSFTITDTEASQTTASLAYNATAAQVQTAIRAALTTNWSTATVTGGTGGAFTIANGVNGSQTALVGTSSTLTPISSVIINRLQDGTGSLPEIQTLQLSVNPFALQDSWTATFSPDILTGALSLNTAGLEEAIGTNACIFSTLSIQVIPASGEAFTVYQNNFRINSDQSIGAPSIPTPGVSYYTTVQSDTRYKGIQVQRDATGNQAQHIVATGIGPYNIAYLISNNTSNPINLTLDNGTFDGQTASIVFSAANDITPINVAYEGDNVSVIAPDTFYGNGVCISFMWNAQGLLWFPI